MTIQRFLSSVGVAVLAGVAFAAQAATISISSREPAGVGSTDGRGARRQPARRSASSAGVYRYVANIWRRRSEPVTITVSAGWEALTYVGRRCSAPGAWNIWHDFAGGVPGTWYPGARQQAAGNEPH
jgi:hypothetical protein